MRACSAAALKAGKCRSQEFTAGLLQGRGNHGSEAVVTSSAPIVSADETT
jgi:hypothetical protein